MNKVFLDTDVVIDFLVSRKLPGAKKAHILIEEIMQLVRVAEVGEKEVKSALKSNIKDFEDALQHALANKVKGVKCIITRNTKGYRNSLIPIFIPETYLKMTL